MSVHDMIIIGQCMFHLHLRLLLVYFLSLFLLCILLNLSNDFSKNFSKSIIMKIFLFSSRKSRIKWQYWYGQYIEWGFFVYLSALLLLLLVICCPEWAYAKVNSVNIFREIGLFKQCYLSAIYKKSPSTGYCTLSNSKTNQGRLFIVFIIYISFLVNLAWVNAVQAFMLMAYIINIIILIVIVVFRKEFRHNEQGYFSDRLSQPTFTYIIAGLILFFGCK
jgi:hypothetical protein